ncbi:FAD-dependent oxidoreductase [Stappia sp. GBMRC 2046]|uniref:FAD-dependent oxidoreductase n=1 Tax=Stappia sediminis TaxID=2692190 RepID=A0A7X3LUS7_9HYPH|nr:FAD-binding oxidoreductase [Stappia sediminis]MXN65455.1 FAD-dependent oxidoreductase [Stappia sediminis]
MKPQSVHILGAGIIGLATAAVLIDRGFDVTVIDREGPGEGTSRGNAAAIAWTDVAPLASPGIWKKAPGWLLDPLGPLTVRPSYAFNILPWMLRFMQAATPSAMKRSTQAIAALNGLALPAWERIWERMAWSNHVRHEGCLDVFDKPSQLAEARGGWQSQRNHGMDVRELSGDELREMEPDLSSDVVGGAYLPGWLHVDDPYELCRDLAAYVMARGGSIMKGEAVSVARTETGAIVRLEEGHIIKTEALVIACGAWSKWLAAEFGDDIPLDTERGYNITVPVPGVSFRRFIMLPGYGFVMSPIARGLRIGGAVEFGGLKAAPNWQRVDALVARAKRIAPNLNADHGERWMGFRPSIPDSLPVISRASGGSNVFYAFGHAHHGLTQAAATAEILASLIAGEEPPVDIAPYRANRF